MSRRRRHRIFKHSLIWMAGILITLAMSIPGGAAIANGPINTNAVAAEEQRVLQFHLAEEAYQQQLKVGRERYQQKQINRAKIIAAMSSELQARQQTVVIQPVAGASPFAHINGPVSWFQPWVAVAVLAVGFFCFAYHLNRQRVRGRAWPQAAPHCRPGAANRGDVHRGRDFLLQSRRRGRSGAVYAGGVCGSERFHWPQGGCIIGRGQIGRTISGQAA